MLAIFSNIGPWQIIAVLVIALLLFGSRLPEVARSIGRAMNEFKRGLREVSDDTEDRTRDDEAEQQRKRKEFNAPPDETYARGEQHRAEPAAHREERAGQREESAGEREQDSARSER